MSSSAVPSHLAVTLAGGGSHRAPRSATGAVPMVELAPHQHVAPLFVVAPHLTKRALQPSRSERTQSGGPSSHSSRSRALRSVGQAAIVEPQRGLEERRLRGVEIVESAEVASRLLVARRTARRARHAIKKPRRRDGPGVPASSGSGVSGCSPMGVPSVGVAPDGRWPRWRVGRVWWRRWSVLTAAKASGSRSGHYALSTGPRAMGARTFGPQNSREPPQGSRASAPYVRIWAFAGFF